MCGRKVYLISLFSDEMHYKLNIGYNFLFPIQVLDELLGKFISNYTKNLATLVVYNANLRLSYTKA